jgi:hypothetical protein
VCKKVERHRAGRDEKHEDPDRPMGQTVPDPVARADGPVRRQLNPSRVPVIPFV